ncbi:MAG TPA: shikimate kinase [Clostridia bacterium]|jgi:shikimate dehydrogenase|nr:shikimate kinase [Clostridia bacterium]
MTKYCLIGKTLKHSLSPNIYKEFGLKDYSLVELEDEKALEQFVIDNSCDGFNVTIPYKQEIMKYLKGISEEASSIGAVNTVVKKPDGLYGYNTDILGMEYAINKAGIILKDKVVAILGTGGTSKTAKYLAEKHKAKEIIIVSRKGPIDYNNVYNHKGINVIINTTPVGMYPNGDGIPIDITRFENLSGVYDAIYNPLTTNIVREAKKRNIPSDNGLSMLVEQGREALAIYGIHPTNDTQTVINNIKKDRYNIILVGMPGCGKSTIGKALADKMSRPFYDTDDEIIKLEKTSIDDIFESKGEKYFRDIESKVISNLGSLSGAIISLGGGAVLRDENRNTLARNGIIVYIKRDLEKLAVEGRPLSKSSNLEQMAKQRKPIYEAFSSYTVENNQSLEEVVNDTYIKFIKQFE